jgi:inorganic triphosphatase YgiF
VPVEVELQFEFRGEGRLVVPIALCDLELRRSKAMSILDTYYDTTSLELRRRGCSLRVRQAENVVRPLLTLKGPSKRRGGAKRRYEAEVQIDQLPADIADMSSLLRDFGLLGELERLAGFAKTPELVPIGEIRNRRSEHRYEHGLHRLDLTWDDLQFPAGSPQIRLELEARSGTAERLLDQAAKELHVVFGDWLVKPQCGKTRELCERLYPGLLAA